MEGQSLVYTFDDAKAKERRTTQYFEIAGNRAIYHDGWYARTIHRAPWEPKPRRSLEDNSAWQLYDVRSDFSLANDLAAKHPQKLKELQEIFLSEAAKYHVLPMDDRVFERLDGAAVGRPDLMGGRTSMTLAEGMTGMMESVFINVKNRSKTITAELECPGGRRERHDPGARRPLRRLVPVRQGRRTGVRIQLPGPAADPHCGQRAAGTGQGDAEVRLRLRRRRPGQRWRRHPLRQWREGRGRPDREHPGGPLLGGRDCRRGHRPRHAGRRGDRLRAPSRSSAVAFPRSRSR